MIPAALLTLLEAVIRTLLAACILGAVLKTLRVKNVPVQKAAWALVLLAAFAMPLMMRWEWLPSWAAVKLPTPSWTKISDSGPPSAVAPVVSLPPAYKQDAASELAPVTLDESYDVRAISTTESPTLQTAITGAPNTPSPATAPPVSKPAPKSLLPRVFALAWLAYLGIGAALLLRLVFALAASIRIWVGAKPFDGLRATNIPSSIPIRASRQIASPVNIGSGILLPAGYESWDDEKLHVVLAHEYAHIQQRDYYLQLLAGIYAACTWFSPLGWWLKRKLSELGEAISDHAGLEAAVSPSAYAELLLEFAASPRLTLSGVAMANSSNLSQRIERLLNESSFRQTFAGGRRVLVSLMIPAVLIAAVSLVRVKADATTTESPAPQAAVVSVVPSLAPPANTIRAHHVTAQVTEARLSPLPQDPAPPTSSAPAPAAAPAPQAAPAAPAPPMPATSQQEPAPAPMPIPHVHVEVRVPPVPPVPHINIKMSDFRSDEEAYVIVRDPGSKPSFHGHWDVDGHAEVDKARKIASGHFILFRRDGKSYIIDDPAIVSSIEDMDNTVQNEGEQMRAIGQQMRDAGHDLHDQIKSASQEQREAVRKAQEASAEIPTPDISKEMAELNAAVAALQAKQGGTISREQLNEIQRKIGEIQRRVIEAEVKVNVKVDFDMSKFNEAQSKFNAEQGALSAQMGKLGAEMGRAMRENNEKLKSTIDSSLNNGKARQVN